MLFDHIKADCQRVWRGRFQSRGVASTGLTYPGFFGPGHAMPPLAETAHNSGKRRAANSWQIRNCEGLNMATRPFSGASTAHGVAAQRKGRKG